MGCTGSKATNEVPEKMAPQVVEVQVVEPGLETEELGGHPGNPSSPQATKRPSDISAIPSSSPKHIQTWDINQVEKACFGAGCYWGTEKYFRHDFARKHTDLGTIHQGLVGFMGPIYAAENPTYREVCSGETGHVEVYELEYAGGAGYYEALVRFFFQFHDPTTLNKQGNDKGTQYASVIYCYSDEQYEIAHRIKDELQALLDTEKLTCFKGKVVSTDIRRSTKFHPAHAEHQDYLMHNPNGYCNHRIRFKEWPVDSSSSQ